VTAKYAIQGICATTGQKRLSKTNISKLGKKNKSIYFSIQLIDVW